MSFQYVKYIVVDENENVVGMYDNLTDAEAVAEDYTEQEETQTAVCKLESFFEPVHQAVCAVRHTA